MIGGQSHVLQYGNNVVMLGGAGNKVTGNQSYFFGSSNEFLCGYGTQEVYVFGTGHRYNKEGAQIQGVFIIGSYSNLS